MAQDLTRTILTRCPRFLRQAARCWYYPGLVRNFQEADWPCARVAASMVAPGDRVIDAGANVGYVTNLLARWVGVNGQVYSFEPVPDTYRVLTRVMRKLGANQVQTFPYALSSIRGHSRMEIPNYSEGGENFYESRLVNEPGVSDSTRRVQVECRTLDELSLDAAGPVSFIKVDVEGHELEVVRGGSELVQSSEPVLLIEIADDLDDSSTRGGQLRELLAGWGYGDYCLEGDGLIKRQAGRSATDYFFLTKDHVEKHAGLVGQA